MVLAKASTYNAFHRDTVGDRRQRKPDAGAPLLDIQLCATAILGETLNGKSLPIAFEDAFRRHPSLSLAGKSAVRDICYQGLRSWGLIEAQLGKLLLTPIRHPALRCLLAVGLTQLQFTRAKPYAVVDHAVRAADKLGQPAARGLVNAVLRNFLRQRRELDIEHWDSPEARYGFPAWWVQKLKTQYPAHWEGIIASQNRHPPMTLRVNRRRISLQGCLDRMQTAGIESKVLGPWTIRIDPRPVGEIPGFSEGWVSVQDAGAQIAADLLDARDGMRVLDACAAPGGKTGHLLELANLDLFALDTEPARLQKINSNLERLGLSAQLVAGSASQPTAWWDGRAFQRILVDCPCSASGVARRNPDIRWKRRPSDLCKFATTQLEILVGVWQVLETSGKLLYATCSLFREENEEVIEAFLARQADARVVPPDLGAPEGGKVLPDDDHDGFFYALLQKH